MTTPPTDAPNAMVTAVQRIVDSINAYDGHEDEDARSLIAAMLDNLPRDVMIHKVAREDCRREVFSHSKGSLDADVAEINRTWKRHIPEATEHVDNAILAARKEILGHD